MGPHCAGRTPVPAQPAQLLRSERPQFDLLSRLRHRNFPGGAALHTPTLALAMWFEQLREAL